MTHEILAEAEHSFSINALPLLWHTGLLKQRSRNKGPQGTFKCPKGHDYLIKYAYFDKMLFRTVCFYQWSWKLNYKCSLMALAIDMSAF